MAVTEKRDVVIGRRHRPSALRADLVVPLPGCLLNRDQGVIETATADLRKRVLEVKNRRANG